MRLLFPPVSIALLSIMQMQGKQAADETAVLTKRLQESEAELLRLRRHLPERCGWFAVEDVDRDDRIDLVVHVPTAELGLDRNSTSLTLVGETFDRERLTGTDAVQIVPPKFGVRR